MRRVLWCGWLLFLVLLGACQGPSVFGERAAPGLTVAADEAPAQSDPATNPLAGAFFNDASDGDIRGRSTSSPAGADPSAPVRRERLLIYRGDLRVEVARADDAAREFLTKVVEWGGYLQSQQGALLVVRLPTTKFDAAFAAIRAAGRVLSESRQANDVTEEFVDLGLRIDTARKSRERLVEVLKKAEKVEEILKVEAELRRLTEEIERMEGRQRFLADQVALATLQVAFQAKSEPPPVKKTRQWNRFDWVNQVGAETMMGDF